MRRRVCRFLLLCASTVLLLGLLTVGANASNYPYGKMTFSSMPSNWQNVTVKVGDVTMPLSKFPDGHVSNDNEVGYFTSAEFSEYGITNTSSLWTRGTTCVGFARHVYAALFYKYPQNASIDTGLGTSYGNSRFYYDVIMEVYGTRELAAGYSAATLKDLFSYCRPGAIFSTTNGSYNHTMVIMAIYDDGFLVYDCNFSDYYEVDVRKYTWQEFVNARGRYNIAGLHMPIYYPGFSYSSGSGSVVNYNLDKTKAGEYVVYNCSSLNVRTQPTTSSSAVGSIAAGTTVQVAGTYGNWAQITYQGGSYWVHTDYLRVKTAEITVTFDGNGATPSFTSRTYTVGQSFGTMPTASKADRILIGWTNGSTVYNSDSTVPAASSLALRAKWGVLTFLDVDESSWYANKVESMTNLGLFAKASNFNPGAKASRAQFVTVLGREYERETGTKISRSGNAGFTDVVAGAYYSRYVVWGKETEIVAGYSDNRFGTYDDVTREQMVSFLYRLAVYTGLTTKSSVDTSRLNQFSDASSVSNYARNPMAWSINVGIIVGDNNGKLRPRDPCTRAEMATMFSRYVNYYNTQGKRVSAPAVESKAEPAVTADPAEQAAKEAVAAAPQTAIDPSATAKPQTTEVPDVTAEPAATETPETTPAAAPEATAEPEPEVSPEPEATAEPEPEVSSEPEDNTEPEAETAMEPEPDNSTEEEPETVPEPEVTAEPEISPEPETTTEPEDEIPAAPEGMINVIFDLDGGKLEEPKTGETPEAAEEASEEESAEDPAETEETEKPDPRVTEPQKYGARYVLCRKPGDKLEILLATPVKENMVFLGWFCGNEEYTVESLIPTSEDPEHPLTELVLKAKWGPAPQAEPAE